MTSKSARQRVLIITRNLPPLVGGMERLNWHMAEELAKHADVRVVGPAGAAALGPRNVVIDEAPLKPLSRFLLGAQWRALKIARKWRPDVVLGGSGLVAPLAWLTAKMCGARTAVYVHGLDLTVQHMMYRAFWLPAICHFDRVIANSQATRNLAVDAGVHPSRIDIVHPGVDLSVVPAEPTEVAGFRATHQLGQRPLLLSVGRLSRRKGMREFVADVLPGIVAQMPDVMLLIVGDTPKQALNAEAQSAQSIQLVANARGVGDNIRFLGLVSDAELAMLYQVANIHVFPVQHIPHDPEGFGMVALEAAAHGLPTVAYGTGGVVDAVAEGLSGYLVPPRDAHAMVLAIINTLRAGVAMRASSKTFASNFGWPAFGDSIHRLLRCSDDPARASMRRDGTQRYK